MNPIFLTQYLIFGVFTALMLLVAFVLKSYLRRYNYGILSMFVWGGALNVFLFLDFFKINRDKVIVGLTLVALGFIGFSLRNRESRQRVIENFRVKVYVGLMVAWVMGLIILNLPLLRGFPPTTMVTGTLVSDDSVVHANLARGFEFTDGSRYTFSSVSDSTSPRAFHSFAYYLNLNNKEAYEILLPAILFGYSLVIFAVYSIVNGELKWSKWNYLLLLAPVTPFIVVNAAYTMFLNQVVVIPLLIAAVYFLMRLDLKQLQKWDFVIGLTLFAALFNTYSILPVAVAGFALFIRILYFLFQERKNISRESSGEVFTSVRQIKLESLIFVLIALVGLAILSVPGFVATKNLLAFESQTQSLTSSVGNLPDGFLDAAHVTGMWPDNVPYRGYLSGIYAETGFILMCYLVIQVLVIARARVSSRLLLVNTVFFIPLFAGMFILKNRYIDYKFLTFFVPVFVTTFLISIYKVAEQVKLKRDWIPQLVAFVICALVIAAAVVAPLRGYRKFVPTIQDFQFLEMKLIAEKYFPNNSALILSSENWFQYFSQEQDDYVPMTLYYVKSYYGEPLDTVVVDEGYRDQVEDYLDMYQPELHETLHHVADECITKPLGRYTVYDLNCEHAD